MSTLSFKQILAEHQREAPIKVGALAAALGLRVVVTDLPLGVSGKLSREPNGDWVIRVARGEHKNRQRFTIAHEISHFVLHRNQIEDNLGSELSDDTFYRSGLSERIEWEANNLAADILMPWQLIRAATQEARLTPAELASIFEVSEAAMKIRLGLPT